MDLNTARTTRRQTICLITAALAAPGTALGDSTMSDDQNLRILAQLTGDTYRAYRDSLLSSRSNFAALESAVATEGDWRLPMTAAILNGWQNRRDQFVQVSESVRGASPEGAVRPRAGGSALTWDTVEMRAYSEYGAGALPLAWEVVTKFHETMQPDAVASYLAVISGVPDAASVAPVASLIEQSQNRLLRERAAYCLSRLPRAPVDAALDRLDTHAAGIAETVAGARDLMQ